MKYFVLKFFLKTIIWIQKSKRELTLQIEIMMWKVDYISSNMAHPVG